MLGARAAPGGDTDRQPGPLGDIARGVENISNARESCPAFEKGRCPFGHGAAEAAAPLSVAGCPAFAGSSSSAGDTSLTTCPFKDASTVAAVWEQLARLPPSHFTMPPLLDALEKVCAASLLSQRLIRRPSGASSLANSGTYHT